MMGAAEADRARSVAVFCRRVSTKLQDYGIIGPIEDGWNYTHSVE